MNVKTMFKMIIDIIMLIIFLILRAYHITGNMLHEWLGISLFVLFILHNILNWNWYRSIFKGKYTPVRILNVSINFLLLVSMIGMMASGIMISRDVFVFLNIRVGMFGRRLHMISTAWGFVLMAIHLGFHWGMVLSMTKKIMGKVSETRISIFICRVAVCVLSVYGIYAFIARKLWGYMFLTMEYALFNYNEPAIFFFMDYIAIIGLITCITYYFLKFIKK